MKSSFLVLLWVMLLSTNQVHPLVCFTCEKASCNWACLKKMTRCSKNDTHCLTTVASIGVGLLTLGKRITKKCSPTCPDWNMHLGIGSFGTSCCQSSLCNFWGHVSLRNKTK